MWIYIRACSEKHTIDQIAQWSLLGILSWYPPILVKSLQLLWWSEKCGWHLRVPDPRLSTRILRCDPDLSIINIPWQRNLFLPHLNKRWVKVHSDAFTMNYFFSWARNSRVEPIPIFLYRDVVEFRDICVIIFDKLHHICMNSINRCIIELFLIKQWTTT